MKKLTEDFNNVSVTRREVFQIELPAITSGGYMWELSVEGEGRVLSKQTILPPGNAIGGGVTQRFTLVADKPGTLNIQATYKRPWETVAAKTQSFKVTVI